MAVMCLQECLKADDDNAVREHLCLRFYLVRQLINKQCDVGFA